MEQNKNINQFDIPLAKRTYLENPNTILLKKLLISSPFLLLIFSMIALRFIRNLEVGTFHKLIFQVERNHDHRVLGHLPYKEIPREKLVFPSEFRHRVNDPKFYGGYLSEPES